MSSEFHEWLDNCPVKWYRTDVDDESATYCLIAGDDDAEEDK
jgi:hypothetical protein